MLYIALVLIFLSVWILTAVLAFTFFYKEKVICRLKYFDEDYEFAEKIEIHKKDKSNLLRKMGELIPNIKLVRKQSKKFEMELIKADIPITAEELLLIKFISSITLSLFASLILKNLVLGIITFVVVWNIPKVIISRRKKERIRNFDSQLNEGIMIISNSLKAGYSFLQSVSAAAEETKEPFASEFKKLFKEMSLGISEEASLLNLLNRMESGDLKLIINAILIQKDIGGNLSEILDNIGETIRERQKIQGELKTLTAQGKLSGIIVILIPIFLGLIIFLFNKEYILLLFNNSLGLMMISISVINQILGVVMIKRIIKIDM